MRGVFPIRSLGLEAIFRSRLAIDVIRELVGRDLLSCLAEIRAAADPKDLEKRAILG